MLRRVAVSTAAVLLATVSLLHPARGDVSFIPHVQIDGTTACCLRCPAAARTGGGTLCAIWVESQGPGYSPYLLMHRRSTDGGLTWPGPSLRLNEGSSDAGHTALAAGRGENLFAVWQQGLSFWFVRSDNGGIGWSEPVDVDPGGWNFGGPSLAVAGDTVIIGCWTNANSPDPSAPAVIVSEDGGGTWSPPRGIDMTLFPSVWDGENPQIAWEPVSRTIGMVISTLGEQLLFVSSTSLGLSWTSGARVNDTDPDMLESPDIIAAGGRYHFVWSDTRNGDSDIWYSRTQDGVHFKANARVDDGLPGYQFEPQLRSGPGGVLHANWFSAGGAGHDVYYARSSDGGETWLAPAPRVNDQPHSAESWWFQASELLVDDSGEALVFWRDAPGGGTAHLAFSRSSTTSAVDPWMEPSTGRTHLQITGNPGPSPRIRLLGGFDAPAIRGAHDDDRVVELFRVNGQLVSVFPAARIPADGLSLTLPGRHRLPSGVYVVRLRGSRDGEILSIVR